MLSCHNYEIGMDGGYRRVDGYALVGQVPGSGPVRGLVLFNGVLYAFRDNASGTECAMYSHALGDSDTWTLVTTPTLDPGGNYEFHQYNFYASSGSNALYGVDGVNQGFVFDGTTFTQISTGMTTDIPTHLICYKKHLFYSFAGGSVQHSSIGEPTTWSAVTGAAEIGVGDEIQGFSEEVGGSLFVFSRNRIDVLLGSSSADWQLQPYSSDSGNIAGTIQRIGQSIYLDDRGLLVLEASQVYGDFKAAIFSASVDPLLKDLLKKYDVNCSQIVREKNQYRLYFSDGSILVATFAGSKLMGFTRSVFPHTMQVCSSGEDTSGVERIFYADSSGNVYEEGGNSFAGEVILNFFRLPYYHYGAPTRRKQFRRVLFEALAEGSYYLSVAPAFNYSNSDSPRAVASVLKNDLAGAQGFWDSSSFGDFNWSVPFSPSEPVRLTGHGANMSLLVSGTAIDSAPHTLYGAMVDFDYRGQNR
jgi:hypothetical protein